MLFSILQLFISVWMEKCYTFKGQNLEHRTYFRLYEILFPKGCRASMTKHRQQRIKVKIKEKGVRSDLFFPVFLFIFWCSSASLCCTYFFFILLATGITLTWGFRLSYNSGNFQLVFLQVLLLLSSSLSTLLGIYKRTYVPPSKYQSPYCHPEDCNVFPSFKWKIKTQYKCWSA